MSTDAGKEQPGGGDGIVLLVRFQGQLAGEKKRMQVKVEACCDPAGSTPSSALLG